MVRIGIMRARWRYIVKCVKRSLQIHSPSEAFEVTDREREEAMCALNRALSGYEGDIPCVPGDTIYYIEALYGGWRYYELRTYTVSHLIIRKEGITVMAHEIIDPGMCLCRGEDFGRIAFTDKKEAEKRLDKLNKGR